MEQNVMPKNEGLEQAGDAWKQIQLDKCVAAYEALQKIKPFGFQAHDEMDAAYQQAKAGLESLYRLIRDYGKLAHQPESKKVKTMTRQELQGSWNTVSSMIADLEADTIGPGSSSEIRFAFSDLEDALHKLHRLIGLQWRESLGDRD